MNYISHYFLDAQPYKPYHNFGLSLPDMMGAAQRGWKPDFSKISFQNTKQKALAEGIKKHHRADAIFHSSLFFREKTTLIRQIFEKNGFIQENTRLFFVAHIFLEFMLDRIIILQHPLEAKHFYEDIDMVADETLHHFFAAAASPADNFPAFLQSFRRHKYLYSYVEDKDFFYALNRTLQRAGQHVFHEKMLPGFQEIIMQAENILSPVYEDFFNEIKQN